ncbi:DEAD/DEAH box helicase [Bacillus sp. FJAT-45066]|uniref:DEAD/DEAH box helicase n=1 Tax=Bacillus sp. FJAT-45066 TaxID=2011010 RepID=UPI000BB9AB2A|nr:DEAD/DEAH box helicase [Bacillus sp. FJAT-45066]
MRETWQFFHKHINVSTPPLNPNFTYSQDLKHFLLRKRLPVEELNFPTELLRAHYRNGHLSLHQPIIKKQNKPYCPRCSNNDLHLFGSYHCARCNKLCTYCRNCIMMGRVSECSPLVSWNGPDDTKQPTSDKLLHWTGTLSSFQQRAATEVIRTVEQQDELLVWAVCGAGKTEVLFPGIERALQLGHKVCIATPRTDVVLELSPRIKQAFPTIEVATLYGGSEDRKKISCDITISTTHQLLRYYNAFDTIIIDEVDAFPYSYDKSLQHAVQEARKDKSAIIYLSATPSKSMQKLVHTKKLNAIKIPQRYHGHPLPVPRFEWCGNWSKKLEKGKLPKPILKWIQAQQTQTFIFVPRIEHIEKVLAILEDSNVAGVHAEDPERKGKVAKFRKGEVQMLVTTTILERGVTVPNVRVAVLGADDHIFTESALVQIAGRVGRSASYPIGDVTFFHYGKTKEMVAARHHIVKMNEEARRLAERESMSHM